MNTTAAGWDCHVHVFDGGQAPVPGHYAPPLRTLSTLEEAAAEIAVSRFVLVQPSVYGTDNRLLLEALRAGKGWHRGVVVVDASIDDRALRQMDDLGVRGVRFNLVSPVGNSQEALSHLAPRLRELRWHVQWYARTSQLAPVAAFHERHELIGVLDHLAGVTHSFAADSTAWEELRRIAGRGGWLKLSGWYRLDSIAPYADLHDTIRRAAALFDDRCVWGSDWPHTHFLETGSKQPTPSYGETWLPVPRALGEAFGDRVLRLHPQRLYA